MTELLNFSLKKEPISTFKLRIMVIRHFFGLHMTVRLLPKHTERNRKFVHSSVRPFSTGLIYQTNVPAHQLIAIGTKIPVYCPHKV